MAWLIGYIGGYGNSPQILLTLWKAAPRKRPSKV